MREVIVTFTLLGGQFSWIHVGYGLIKISSRMPGLTKGRYNLRKCESSDV